MEKLLKFKFELRICMRGQNLVLPLIGNINQKEHRASRTILGLFGLNNYMNGNKRVRMSETFLTRSAMTCAHPKFLFLHRRGALLPFRQVQLRSILRTRFTPKL